MSRNKHKYKNLAQDSSSSNREEISYLIISILKIWLIFWRNDEIRNAYIIKI